MKRSWPTLIIKNNTGDIIPIELFKNPPSVALTTGQGLEYTWNVCSILFTKLTTVQVQARPTSAVTFTTYTATIADSSLEGVVATLNTLGLGIFYTGEVDGETSILIQSASYVFGELEINTSDLSNLMQFTWDITFNSALQTFVIEAVQFPNAFGSDQLSGSDTLIISNGSGSTVFVSILLDNNPALVTINVIKNGCLFASKTQFSDSVVLPIEFTRNDDQYEFNITIS